jgi:hypothetical protein
MFMRYTFLARHFCSYSAKTVLLPICLFFPALLNAETATSFTIPSYAYERLTHQHHAFSRKFHQTLLQQNSYQLKTYNSVKPLEAVVNKHIDRGEKLLAAGLVVKNIPMLKNNYDNLVIFNFIDILLEQNEWHYAKLLYDWIKQEGDRTLVSNIAYIFAKYSFKQEKWQETLDYLKGSISDLPHEDYHHALLIKGISLQKLTNHRGALHAYNKIPKESRYFIAARLNMAIANIRQGWWTDGHILIEQALAQSETKQQEESLNRLYLTLGYSFLNQEYYRHSRNAFRKVGLRSTYTNKALLGLSLTAANQEDFIGALNAAKILKQQTTYALPVDEAYLLIPYYYEKLQQHTTATSGYTEAVTYYQKRISKIKTLINSPIDVSHYLVKNQQTTSILIENNPINFSQDYPEFILENYIKLHRYPPYLAILDNEELNEEFTQLRDTYENLIKNMIHTILKQRIQHLNSYMDQSRFGLARLYDNNLVAK